MNNLSLGELIHMYMKKNGQSVSWLATQIGCTRNKLYRFFRTSRCDNDFLEEICFFLKCDCFVYYSKKLADNEIINQIV